jgi:endonuclease/exonuclease/phosphatase family metal-dependent hydrolase
MTTIRILSYNIHKGRSPVLLASTVSRIRESIREVNADIVFLQEICGAQTASVNGKAETASQLEFLADEVWPYFSYGKNAVYDGGHHGNAILSKFPVVEYLNTDVSAHRFEQRGILFARVLLPEEETTIDCYCLHFGLFSRGRLKQLNSLCTKVSTVSSPSSKVIIAGDFNDWTKQATQLLERELGMVDAHVEKNKAFALSFPSRFPLLALDRVFVRGMKVISVSVLSGGTWGEISDHAPLLTEVSTC